LRALNPDTFNVGFQFVAQGDRARPRGAKLNVDSDSAKTMNEHERANALQREFMQGGSIEMKPSAGR
jgi:hypothetical protein